MADMLETPLGRRIVAAAALRGWERKDIPQQFERYGSRIKFMPSRLARDPDAQPDDHQLDTLARVFGLPRSWFTEPDLSDVVPGAKEPQSDAVPGGDDDPGAEAQRVDLKLGPDKGAGGAAAEPDEGKAADA